MKEIAVVWTLLIALGNCHNVEKRQVSNFRNPSSRVSSLVPVSLQEFAFDLSFEQWQEGNKGNLLFSPLSIGSILSLLMLGTNGRTKTEIEDAMNYPQQSENAVHRSYEAIIDDLNTNVPGVEVIMTNRLFLAAGQQVLGSFSNKAQQHYETGLQSVNFADKQKTMKEVNDYVNRNTKGKIPQLITEPFSPNSLFVAVNTIYFNGLWENPFDKDLTFNGKFNTGRSQITIPMMSAEMVVRHLKDDTVGIEMIGLPYKGNKYSLYIIKPTSDTIIKPNGELALTDLEHMLNQRILSGLIDHLAPTKLIVSLPRMSLKTRLNLKKDLNILGVSHLFDGRADFSRMANQRGLFVDNIVHEAVLEMTETGTVAAAATATSSDRNLVKSFKMDEPSLIFIRDDSNGVILFWGRVVEPTPLFA